MTNPFDNLAKDKQKRIINAALKEFAEQGFDRASTNKIVKDADIGKGMLFYYFQSKQGLYHYLIDYALDITEQKYLNLIGTSESDLFERLKEMAEIKIKFLKKYPDAMNFMTKSLFIDEEEIDQTRRDKIEQLQKIGQQKVYENIDLSLFREDVDPQKAFKIIRWAFDGYEAEMKLHFKNKTTPISDLDPYWEEFYAYIDVMKKSFYK